MTQLSQGFLGDSSWRPFAQKTSRPAAQPEPRRGERVPRPPRSRGDSGALVRPEKRSVYLKANDHADWYFKKRERMRTVTLKAEVFGFVLPLRMGLQLFLFWVLSLSLSLFSVFFESQYQAKFFYSFGSAYVLLETLDKQTVCNWCNWKFGEDQKP